MATRFNLESESRTIHPKRSAQCVVLRFRFRANNRLNKCPSRLFGRPLEFGWDDNVMCCSIPCEFVWDLNRGHVCVVIHAVGLKHW